MSESHRVGVTPYVLRLAAHYATLGVGTYNPTGYGQFNRVEVRIAQPWENREPMMSSLLVLRVEFYLGAKLVRFVEFALTPEGFGGDAIMKTVNLED